MADSRLIHNSSSFSSFDHILDARILRALADIGFARPTLVQSKAIPIALENRDTLVRAKTGSGKTAAYCIPVVQKILTAKDNSSEVDPTYRTTRALILVPTRELSEQVLACLRDVTKYCDKEITLLNTASGFAAHLQHALLADKPDILIATPSRVLGLLQSKAIDLASLETLVIDEADLILSYGHDEDIRQIFGGTYLPKVYQSFLMSATMTEDVETLKGLTLRSPAVLKLEDDQDEVSALTQYSVRCPEVDKFLLVYVILKLRLIKGKCILFVNDVDRCYRLKLFLEQFSIKSCVLNSELPLNSRYHTVQEFNKGVYDYIIASDETGGQPEHDTEDEQVEGDDAQGDNNQLAESAPGESGVPGTASSSKKRQGSPLPVSNPSKKRKSKVRTSDKEYGVTRGIDFVNVACVLNFDLPTSYRAYTHRVGRTARAGHSGMALSFIVPQSEWGKHKVVGGVESTRHDERIWERIEKGEKAKGKQIQEYKFNMDQVEAFRYRMGDALRSVTKNAIKEARIKELKTELLNSEKLKAHFEDNPLDLEYLRHDKPLHPMRIQSHMKHVPKYLLPRVAPISETEDDTSKIQTGFVPFKKRSVSGRGGRRGGGSSGRGGRGKRKADPLKKFR
ncbi:P-loop containing nucleoside triphosphate hydrolase protein [Pisolithus marmoratus]|nr:P-loop containing nucleoside triphosphate hydrolase protein [Pisolithus marmoratus]